MLAVDGVGDRPAIAVGTRAIAEALHDQPAGQRIELRHTARLGNGASADQAARLNPEGQADDPADADIVAQIRDLIETRVRPAVANDGGDIVYRGFDKGKVFLQLQGACAGCPSSSATLKNGIEQLLKYYVPEVTEVRAV